MKKLQHILNALFIYALSSILVGAFVYQFTKNEIPCSLCNLQRLAMIGISIGLFLNLRLGCRTRHYGLALLSATFGLFVALRQTSLHICPQFPPYGEPIFGFDLYVWSFFVFLVSICVLALLLILFDLKEHQKTPLAWDRWNKTAFGCLLLITAANIITSFLNCGFGYCKGV